MNDHRHRGSAFMIGGQSRIRNYWDVVIAFLALTSAFYVVWQLAFAPTRDLTIWTPLYLVDLFFVVDIAINFFTTYRDKGMEVIDTDKIARRYARKLPVDLLANIPWELLLLFIGKGAWLGVPLIIWLRLPRFLRLFRLFGIFKNWESLPQVNPSMLRVFRFAVAAALVIHVVACGWFFTAASQGFPAGNWAEKAGIVNAAPAEQYVRALYWTISTMTTVGFGDITPSLPSEYIVAIMVMLMGASLYAFTVGSIASLLSRLNAEKSRHRDRKQNLSYYLQQRGVSTDLNHRVQGYYEYLWTKRHGLAESELLSDLPRTLQIEIKEQLAQQVLQQIPLFNCCSAILKMELLSSLQLESYGPGTKVVSEGEKPGDIIFVVDGELAVVSSNETPYATLGPGEYFGYLSLVLNERRTASVVATSYCDVMRLMRCDYDSIMEAYPEFREALSSAAAHKTEKMAELVLEGVVL